MDQRLRLLLQTCIKQQLSKKTIPQLYTSCWQCRQVDVDKQQINLCTFCEKLLRKSSMIDATFVRVLNKKLMPVRSHCWLNALLNREPCVNHGLTGNCKATTLTIGKDLIIELNPARNWAIMLGQARIPAAFNNCLEPSRVRYHKVRTCFPWGLRFCLLSCRY